MGLSAARSVARATPRTSRRPTPIGAAWRWTWQPPTRSIAAAQTATATAAGPAPGRSADREPTLGKVVAELGDVGELLVEDIPHTPLDGPAARAGLEDHLRRGH